jgi:antitoxin (DNA-binding transcriptional repressor) of toxin-antitoxin stability system
MKKARISELKNRLSHYLRFVRRGESVLVYDRDRAIARIDPIRDVSDADAGDWTAELERARVLAPPSAALRRDWLKQRKAVACDVVGALLEERESGR